MLFCAVAGHRTDRNRMFKYTIDVKSRLMKETASVQIKKIASHNFQVSHGGNMTLALGLPAIKRLTNDNNRDLLSAQREQSPF